MSKADSLFEWWRTLPASLRPNPFRYAEVDDVEIAQFQATLVAKLNGLQTTLERPFKDARDSLHRELKIGLSAVSDWLERSKKRFEGARFEGDYYAPGGRVRLTWRPLLPQILDWLDRLRATIQAAAREPLARPFLSLTGADPECLEVPDFQPMCGFWSENYLIGPLPWRAANWNAVVGTDQVDCSPFTPQQLAASLAHSVWLDQLEDLVACVRKGHKAVKDCPWMVPHVLCELAKLDMGPDDTLEASVDRASWATSLHVPFRHWLHARASALGITAPLKHTNCYPTWMGFSVIVGDDPTGMIGGQAGHQRACFFAFLLDELSALWQSRPSTKAGIRAYKKPWHGEAFAYLKRHPDASVSAVARAVGKDRSTVGRDETMKGLFAQRQELQRGISDGKGNVDGIVDAESSDD